MSGPMSNCLRFVAVVLAILQVINGQKCYYPNGQEAADSEKPCSSAAGSACCPEKWQCLDNGLCHYPADKLYGRYSCTDKSWKSPGCASNMCTYDMKAVGGESITQCSDHNNDWCCNADAQHVNCCKESPAPRPFFKLQDGKPYATIGGSTPSSAPTLASITGLAAGTDSSSPSSTSSSSASSSSSPSPSSSNSPSSSSAPPSSSTLTSVTTRTSTGASGPVTLTESQTIATSDSTATAVPPPSGNNGDSSSNLPVIVGCAVGVPLGLALAAILFWLFRKRAKQQDTAAANPYTETPDSYPNSGSNAGTGFIGGYKGGLNSGPDTNGVGKSEKPDAAPLPLELESQSVGPNRPISSIPGSAELDTGNGFAQGAAVPHAPHLVGVGGGTGGSANRRYYSGTGQNSFPNGTTATATATATTANTATAPLNPAAQSESPPPIMSSSWGSAPVGYSYSNSPSTTGASFDANPATSATGAGGGYVPYRPPPGHAAYGAGNLSNVPEASGPAELAQPSPPVAELASNPVTSMGSRT